MTQEELFDRLWELAETWGPLAIGAAIVAGLLALLVFGMALTFIVRTWRQVDRDHADMRARYRK